MSQVRAGWYPDPSPQELDERTERYWDGYSWSHQVRRSPSGGPAPAGRPYPDRPFTESSIPSTPDGQVLAGWWMRAAATVADWVVLIPVLTLVAVPSLAGHWHSVVTWWNAGYGAGGTLVTDGSVPNPPVLDPSTGPGLTLYLSVFSASVTYALVFLRWKQATPGKLICGLQVRRRDAPGPLAWSTILRRVGFAAAVGVATQVPTVGFGFLVLAVLDYLWPLRDGNRQALHDKVAGTNVVLRER